MLLTFARWSRAFWALSTLAGFPCHVLRTVFWRARAYEKETCHGFGVLFMQLRLREASSSDCPPVVGRAGNETGGGEESET